MTRQLDDTLETQRAVDDAMSPRPTGSRGLPRVLHEAPAAVLLVDVRSGRVVEANAAGRRLGGPQTPLPVPARRWVEAAGMTTPDGASWDGALSPVERVAAGEPVLGEPVRVVPVGRREDPPRVLWVTGFPVPPTDGDEQALVVFFDVALSPEDMDGAQLRDRAVVAAGLSFTISDPRLPDNPLVFVNPAFERTTGYSAQEVLGRNCRFLQGRDTDPGAVARLRAAIAAEQHAVVVLLNHRKDGTAFWNEVSVSPVYDATGTLTHFVGIQADVTARVAAEHERERHLAAEQAARTEAEQSQRRLALLAEATSMLAATLDVDESVQRLTDLVVPVMADWCTVHLLSPDGAVQQVVGAHVDPDKSALLRRVEQLQPGGVSASSATARVLRGGPPVLYTTVTDGTVDDAADDPELADVYHQLAPHSAIIVPLRARRQVLGALTLVTSGSGRVYDDEDLAMAADLARRAALTVDNARLYSREHDVAEALQRSLLPQLPTVPGLDHAAVYLPGSTAAQVGGDWYDLMSLPDGTVGVAVGDVMGHDLTAAAAMGQLRSVLQSYAWQGSSPAVVLDRLDQLVQGLDMAQLATCIYGRIQLPTADGGPGHLRLCNAGHLPPVLRGPDGTVRLLDSGVSLLVGAALGTDRDEVEEALEPGSVLVLYTDGLVEHRGRDVTEGISALCEALGAAPVHDAAAVRDFVLGRLAGSELEDDVAVLVVRVLP
jgi:PAS domain S-box-containing protein